MHSPTDVPLEWMIIFIVPDAMAFHSRMQFLRQGMGHFRSKPIVADETPFEASVNLRHSQLVQVPKVCQNINS